MAHAFHEEILFAADALRRGEIIAYPTETFYGLAVNALDELALARLRQLKGRGEKAISVLVLGNEMIERLCRHVPVAARKLMARHWPGPLTHRAAGAARDPGAAGRRTAASRSASRRTRRRARWSRCSAARSRRPAPTWRACRRRARPRRSRSCSRGAAVVLHAGATPGGAPSTLVRVRGSRIEVLRQGALVLAAD